MRALAALLLLTLSCEPYASPLRNTRPPGRETPSPEEEDATDDEAEEENEAVTAPSTTSPVVDAGASTPTVNAFASAGAFALTTPADQSTNHHDGSSHAGGDCLGCHTGAGAPKFAIAGTVFRSRSSSEGAAGVQVRVVNSAGVEIALVGTDAEGNFWWKNAAPLPAGSFVGVRDGSTKRAMNASISVGACGQTSCHDAKRPMFLLD
jgi:hypothetical protein